MNHTQIAFPVEVRTDEIARERNLGGAIGLCLKVAGFDMDKQLLETLKVDKAQFSRWQAGTEGIIWEKFARLMDTCGNDAPLLWMAYQRGYDIKAMRKRETELQRENRQLKEQVEALTKVLRA
jgi:plasmid maintenance system antidote protein VapI